MASSDSLAAGVPATVVVAAGGTSATFPVSPRRVTKQAGVTLTATYNGQKARTTLTVTP